MATSTCQSCTRIMREKSDYPRGNFSSIYCTDCVDEKGNLKPQEVVRQNMINYRIKHNGLSEEEATESVNNLMKHLAVWNGARAQV
jgi:hypothetical protein